MGFNDFTGKHKAMLFYNMVVVAAEELLWSLTPPGLLRNWTVGCWAVPTQLSCVVSLCGLGI